MSDILHDAVSFMLPGFLEFGNMRLCRISIVNRRSLLFRRQFGPLKPIGLLGLVCRASGAPWRRGGGGVWGLVEGASVYYLPMIVRLGLTTAIDLGRPGRHEDGGKGDK